MARKTKAVIAINGGEVYAANRRPVVIVFKPQGTEEYQLGKFTTSDYQPMSLNQLKSYFHRHGFKKIGAVITP